MSAAAVLQVRGVSKKFGTRPVLDGVGFDARPGEILGLIGPNGAGKTTLLECLAGTIRADAGTALYEGRDVAAASRRDVLFYVPDAIAPWPDQSVRRVLGFYGALFARAPAQIEQWLGALALLPLLDSRVGALSKGERKRFLLLLGLATPQPVLLLDEPFDGLDLRQARDAARAAAPGRARRPHRSSSRSISCPRRSARATASSCSMPAGPWARATSPPCGRAPASRRAG